MKYALYINKNTIMEPQVRNMMNVIHELNLESFVRDFDNKNGFMRTDDNRINKIGNLVLSDGHSGCSFACCLRNCQYYLNLEPSVVHIRIIVISH